MKVVTFSIPMRYMRYMTYIGTWFIYNLNTLLRLQCLLLSNDSLSV